jgi:biotin-[acetyl-CoA-carboxylase] ligase BirA-like protein
LVAYFIKKNSFWLKTGFKQMKRFHYFEISSTNDYAKEHLKSYDNVVVTADFQSFGRGRNNKIWEGTPGENVYFSYGIKHSKPLNYKEAAIYQAIGALAAINVLGTLVPENTFILKYPNDVYALHQSEYKKISGILVEHSFAADRCTNSVIGIGINVNQSKFNPELEPNVVSLKILRKKIFIDDIYNLLIKKIQFYERLNFLQVFNEWKDELEIINKTLAIKGKPGTWTVKDILDDCRLIVQEKESEEKIIIDNGDSILYELGED